MSNEHTVDELAQICQAAVDTLGAIDEWLGMASTREAAMDSIWRLSRMLKQAGFEYDWRNALEWRGAGMKESNDAGFFKNSEDGFFHYDPTADKQKPYRIYGNAQGPTLKEFVAQAIQEQQAHQAVLEKISQLLSADETGVGLHASQQPHAVDLASAPLRPNH